MLAVRTWLRQNPTIVLGVVASLLWLAQQAVTGAMTWVVVLPLALTILIRSLVTPAAPGWVARNGLLLGVLGSIVVIVGQVADSSIDLAAAFPLILGVFVKLLPDPAIDVTSPATDTTTRRAAAMRAGLLAPTERRALEALDTDAQRSASS